LALIPAFMMVTPSLINNGAAPQIIDAINIPTVGIKAQERVDPIAIRASIQTCGRSAAASRR
jgi:hypothetical protein